MVQDSGDALSIGVHESVKEAKKVTSPCLSIQVSPPEPEPGSSRTSPGLAGSAQRLSQPGQSLTQKTRSSIPNINKPTRARVHVPIPCAITLEATAQARKAWREGFVPFPPISTCFAVPCCEQYRTAGTAEMAKAREKWHFIRTSEVCAAAASAISDATVTGDSFSHVQVCRCADVCR